MELGLSYGNILLVDGRYLRHDEISKLTQALIIGRRLIADTIEIQYQKYKYSAPNVQRGSVWVMNLATNIEDVINQDGIELDYMKQSNRGVFNQYEYLKDTYHPHWMAVEEAELIPEIRTIPSPPRRQKYMKGVNLLVRDAILFN